MPFNGPRSFPEPSQPALSNAFDMMRKAQQQHSFLSKIDKENCIATEKLYNDVILKVESRAVSNG